MATYTVKKGDNLTKIAKQYGTTWQELAKLNKISDPNVIKIGQTINIGDAAASTDPTAPDEPITIPTPGAKSTADWLASYEGTRPVYGESQAVLDAANRLAMHEANRPGAYQSGYTAQIQSILDKIMNREKFEYDFNADPLYQQYADRYQQQGQMAMMDTMANAAALTGGYGNSYATTAGQQAYQGYLQGLNDRIPELRNAAYHLYRDEGDTMLNQMGVLQGLDQTDYGRHRDTVGDWYSDLNYQYGRYRDTSDTDYNRFLNDTAGWDADRGFWYDRMMDEQAQGNWQQQFDQSQSNWQAEYDLALQKMAATGSRSSGGGGSKLKADATDPLADYLRGVEGTTPTNAPPLRAPVAAPTASELLNLRPTNHFDPLDLSRTNVESTNSVGYSASNPDAISWVQVEGMGRIGIEDFKDLLARGEIRGQLKGDKITYVKAG